MHVGGERVVCVAMHHELFTQVKQAVRPNVSKITSEIGCMITIVLLYCEAIRNMQKLRKGSCNELHDTACLLDF